MIKWAIRKFELTGATRFGLFSKVWSLAASPITLFLLVRKLSAQDQGYYYAFIGAVALQALAELGLGSVLTQIVAQAKGRIEKAAISAEQKERRTMCLRDGSLHDALRWYSGIGAIGFCIVIGFGYVVLNDAKAFYFAIFCAYALASVLNLVCVPFLTINAGVGKNDQVAALEFRRQLVAILCLWGGLLLNLGPGALICQQAGAFLVNGHYIFGEYRFKFMQPAPAVHEINWHRDVLPLQARVAAMTLFGALSSNLASPLLLKVYSPAESGQLGISLNVISTAIAFSCVWFIARLPDMAKCVGAGEMTEFRILRARLSKLSFAAYIFAAIAIISAIKLLNMIGLDAGKRFLDWQVLSLLALDGLVVLTSNLSIYSSRCFGREYFLFSSGLVAAISIFGPLWLAPHVTLVAYLTIYYALKMIISLVTVIYAERKINSFLWTSASSVSP
jgi:hypothetical protein